MHAHSLFTLLYTGALPVVLPHKLSALSIYGNKAVTGAASENWSTLTFIKASNTNMATPTGFYPSFVKFDANSVNQISANKTACPLTR